MPLPAFIEDLYFKRFGKSQPDVVRSIEDSVKASRRAKEAKKAAKQQKKNPPDAEPASSE